jgi:hypothetical protein
LNDEEGEYYNIRIPPEDEADVERLRKKMQDMSSQKEKSKPKQRSSASLNTQHKDVVKGECLKKRKFWDFWVFYRMEF